MGLGPSTKMTTLHHYYCPVTRALLKERGLEFCGVVVNGVSERYDDKVFTAARTGDMVECMRVNGAIVEVDGWGNHHIDFVNVIEQLGKRGIPVIGMSYIGQQGRLVCTNSFVDTIVDFNKNESGYESCIVGDNNLTEYDAMKAVALLKYKMRYKDQFGALSEEIYLHRLVRKRYTIKKACMEQETAISQGMLILRNDLIHDIVQMEQADIADMHVRIITPENRHVFVNSNLDFMPIACKVDGEIGTGETHLLTGITAMLTGADDSSGFQPCNIGSSAGFLDQQVKFDQAGTPGSDDSILHIDVSFKTGKGCTISGIRAAHRAADRVLGEIRSRMIRLEDMPYTKEEFYDTARPDCPKVVLVKVVSGLGNMYETALFPSEPGGYIGARNLMDTANTPFVITPSQCMDGAIHSLI